MVIYRLKHGSYLDGEDGERRVPAKPAFPLKTSGTQKTRKTMAGKQTAGRLVEAGLNIGLAAAVKAKLKPPTTSKKSWKDLFPNSNVLLKNGLLELQLSPLGFVVLSPQSN
jgi:hypothetical protein